MVELAVIISAKGVEKTQIYGADRDLDQGFRLYRRILPALRTIDEVLLDVAMNGQAAKEGWRPSDETASNP